jgi:hypothetical protein
MKREIAGYVSECDICQRVKASHLKTAGVLQPLPIPSWKWEDISMNFIVGLPNTSQRHGSIWVIVDRLTKTTHFLPVHTTYNAKKYAEIYLDQIVVSMEYLRQSFLIVEHSSLLLSTSNSNFLLEPN